MPAAALRLFNSPAPGPFRVRSTNCVRLSLNLCAFFASWPFSVPKIYLFMPISKMSRQERASRPCGSVVRAPCPDRPSS